MLKNISSLSRDNCFLARGTFPLESSEAPPVVAVEVIDSSDGEYDIYFASELQSEVYGKASSIAKVFLENTISQKYKGKGAKPTDNLCVMDFSSLWPQTAPIPPTGLISSAFSLPPLLYVKNSGEGSHHFLQFFFEYYVPEKNDFLHLSSLIIWKTYVSVFSGIYFSCRKVRFQSTLAYYLSQGSMDRPKNGVPDSRMLSCNFFRAGLWSEELLWKLFSSLLSCVALFHSHGYHFSGRINADSILCFTAPVNVCDELHQAMSSTISTILSERESGGAKKLKDGYEYEFDRILALYAKTTETSIILPSCRILESTPAHQVYFVLTSVPVSSRKGTAPHIEQDYQLQDLHAISHVMDRVLSEQESLLDCSLPRASINEEIKILLRCLSFPPSETSRTLPTGASTSPNAVQLLQLQALRLRQAAWLWQSVAEVSQWQGWALRHCLETMMVNRDLLHEETELTNASLAVKGEEGYPANEPPLPPLCGTPSTDKHAIEVSPQWRNQPQIFSDSAQILSQRGDMEKKQDSSVPSTPPRLTQESMCRTCADLEDREKLVAEREEKVASLLELYELTQEQLDRLPNAHHFGYEELRRRLTAHLLRPIPAEPVKSSTLHSFVEAGTGYFPVGERWNTTVLPSPFFPAEARTDSSQPPSFFPQQAQIPFPVLNEDGNINRLKSEDDRLFIPSASVPHTNQFMHCDLSNTKVANATLKSSQPPQSVVKSSATLSSSPPTGDSHAVNSSRFRSVSSPHTPLRSSPREGSTGTAAIHKQGTALQAPPARTSLSSMSPGLYIREEVEKRTPTKPVPSSSTTPVSGRSPSQRLATPPLCTTPITTSNSTTSMNMMQSSSTTSPRGPPTRRTSPSSLSMKSVLRFPPTISNVPLAAPKPAGSQEPMNRRRQSIQGSGKSQRWKDENGGESWLEEKFSTLAALRESFEQSKPYYCRDSSSLNDSKKSTPLCLPVAGRGSARRRVTERTESHNSKRGDVKAIAEDATALPAKRNSSEILHSEGGGGTSTPHSFRTPSVHLRILSRTPSSSHLLNSKKPEPRSPSSSSSALSECVIQMEVEELTPRREEGVSSWPPHMEREDDRRRIAAGVKTPVREIWMCDEGLSEDMEVDVEHLVTPKKNGTPSLHSPALRTPPGLASEKNHSQRENKDALKRKGSSEPVSSIIHNGRGHLLSDYDANELLRKLRSY